MLEKVWNMILDNKEDYDLVSTKNLEDNIIQYDYLNKKEGYLLEVRLQKGKPLYIEFNNL